MSDHSPQQAHNDRQVAMWLFCVAVMIFGAVVIGGTTRLAHAGLSITNWRPLTGWLPPMTDAAWQAMFDGYKKIPEYTQLNSGMTLHEFKGIFWLEFIHRLWGRAIGLVFVLPYLWFLLRGRLDRRLGMMLVGLLCLGGIQGGIGWYMVKSGLVGRLDVSQYRLALHLCFALLIYVLVLRTAFWLRRDRQNAGSVYAGWRRLLWGLLALVAITVAAGAFVAGIDAGFAYNTFPLMDGELIPSFIYDPKYGATVIFDDIATVQFNHRVLAITTLCVVLISAAATWIRGADPYTRRTFGVVLLAAVVQVLLGIATLLSVVQIDLAVMHQACAVILITSLVWAIHRMSAAGFRHD